MDKKAWLVISLCIVGIIGHTYWSNKQMKKYQEEKIEYEKQIAKKKSLEKQNNPTETQNPTNPSPTNNLVNQNQQTSTPQQTKKLIPEETFSLENDEVKYMFTNFGGGISEAVLKNHSVSLKDKTNISLNHISQIPIGKVFNDSNHIVNHANEIVERTDQKISFKSNFAQGVDIIKTYSINNDKSNNIVDLKIKFQLNDQANSYSSQDNFIYLGALALNNNLEDVSQTLFNFYADGKFKGNILPTWFDGSKFIIEWRKPADTFIEKHNNVNFASVSNQFFTIILQNENPLTSTVFSKPLHLENLDVKQSKRAMHNGIQGAMSIPNFNLDLQNSEVTFSYKIYLGSKEYSKLKDIDPILSSAVNYGFFSFISKPLLKALKFIAGIVHNYGLAIIIVTFILRLIMWPLTHKSTQSMKRMSQLNPIVADIRKKYKDNPQKLNKEIMGVYKQYGVNPISSCFPMLLQIPIFIGFYYMLRSAVELRQENFLWVKDLSLPDTIFTIPGINLDINPLPVLMVVTMFFQMKMTPQTGDSTQQKIMMFFPFFLLFILYTFASALALYWTSSNLFSILQTYYTKKLPEPKLTKRAPKKKALPSPLSPNQKPKKKKPKRPKTGG